jgi:hypothetical protein
MPYSSTILITTHSYDCGHLQGFATVLTIYVTREASVTSVDSLLLDAKEAILDEHHQRFQALQKEGRWMEALQQFHTTMTCVSDLLNESLRVLDEAIDSHDKPSGNSTPPPATA